MTTSSPILGLVNKANNLISPTFLSDDLKKTMRAMVLMRLFSELIVAQNDVRAAAQHRSNGSRTINHIQLHQTKLKRLAHTFLCKIDDSLEGFYQQTRVFADLFKTFQATIDHTITGILEDEERLQVVQELLSQLQGAAENLEIKSDKIIQEMATVMAQVNMESTHVQQDVRQLVVVEDDCKDDRLRAVEKLDKNYQDWKEDIAIFVFAGLDVQSRRMQVSIEPSTLEEITFNQLRIEGVSTVRLASLAKEIEAIQDQIDTNYQTLSSSNFKHIRAFELSHLAKALQEACEYTFQKTSNFFSEWHEVAVGLGAFKEKVAAAKSPMDIVYLQTSMQLAFAEWGSIQRQIDTLFQRAKKLGV